MAERDSFPSLPLSPSAPPVTGIYPRTEEVEKVVATLDRGEFTAIWAPRYSGRTTLLHLVANEIRRRKLGEPVYISPEQFSLPLAGRADLFRSLAHQIQSSLAVSYSSSGHSGADENSSWDRPDALRRFVQNLLSDHQDLRLTILLDDCDKLLSGSLVTLLRSLRELRQGPMELTSILMRRVRWLVAGAVSFRNLRLLEQDELSAFDDWTVVHIMDLSDLEVSGYLAEAFRSVGVSADPEAVKMIYEYAGGDLWRINQLARKVIEICDDTEVAARDVERAVRKLMRDYLSDPSLAYMISVIRHDPRCLEVVMQLNEGKDRFLRSHVDRSHDQFFGVSNQELSGAFALAREGGQPKSWKFRNRFSREIVLQHFSAQHLLRSFLDLDRPDRIEYLVAEVVDGLSESFRSDVSRFDESALRDVIEWHWSKSNQEDRVTLGFELMHILLDRVFGFRNHAIYSADRDRSRLIRLDSFPAQDPGSFDAEIEMGLPRRRPTREERAFRSALYTVEIDNFGSLTMAIPLKNFEGSVSGIVNLRSERYMEDWATLFVRVPIVERALNTVWRKLTREEYDRQRVLARLSEGIRDGSPGTKPGEGIHIFVSAKIASAEYRTLRRSLQQIGGEIKVAETEAKAGLIINNVIGAIAKSFLVFDLSKINNNVLFELGLALGLNRPGILLCAVGRRLEIDILAGVIVAQYKIGKPLGEGLLRCLEDKMMAFMKNGERGGFLNLLDIDSERGKIIADPYVVVCDHDLLGDLRSFRYAISRVAKEVGCSVVYTSEATGKLARFSPGSGLILAALENLIDHSLAVIARIEKAENTKRFASRFVAAGIAKGREMLDRRKRLISVVRSYSPEGERVEVPSDFGGLANLSFEPDARKDFERAVKEMLAGISTNSQGSFF